MERRDIEETKPYLIIESRTLGAGAPNWGPNGYRDRDVEMTAQLGHRNLLCNQARRTHEFYWVGPPISIRSDRDLAIAENPPKISTPCLSAYNPTDKIRW